MAVVERVADWIDERTGSRALLSAFLDRKLPKVGWLFTLGSASMLVFTIMLLTGAVLTMNYSPSPEHAYDSVRYIDSEVLLGGLVRALHKWGASAMVLLVFLHMLRTFFMGAYKYPRELTWLVGVLLLLLTLLSGFTGYLLPWDQKAYWATAVGTNMAHQAPFIGSFALKVLRGGEELGTVTLTRFYSLHMIGSVTIALLIGLHLFMVVKEGIAGPPDRMEERRLYGRARR
jgi:quinol-cytochrome oxidoreductase complex cytochrome b subunit